MCVYTDAMGFVGDVYLTLTGMYGSGPETKLTPANQPPSDAADAIKAAAAKVCMHAHMHTYTYLRHTYMP